ncbi:DUF29 family protein [Nodosilinea sp. LEGE 07088]|uniref:DUF29 family protein n=1 Tax=Nodosilinea sp. LEGE 07088 TaxID=2777968 RepID=UPI001880F028|nr:DUF29 family protein [Nodosilinea sp. LEGE 07088]MBE9138465.1 DUF29 family protein [Nodosilinea sp. LEGE 07088]
MTGLYETDFYAWTQQQSSLLKQNVLEKLDLPHLVEELEALGHSKKRPSLPGRLYLHSTYSQARWMIHPPARFTT